MLTVWLPSLSCFLLSLSLLRLTCPPSQSTRAVRRTKRSGRTFQRGEPRSEETTAPGATSSIDGVVVDGGGERASCTSSSSMLSKEGASPSSSGCAEAKGAVTPRHVTKTRRNRRSRSSGAGALDELPLLRRRRRPMVFTCLSSISESRGSRSLSLASHFSQTTTPDDERWQAPRDNQSPPALSCFSAPSNKKPTSTCTRQSQLSPGCRRRDPAPGLPARAWRNPKRR